MGYRSGKRRNRLYATGSDHARWLGGNRESKRCQLCDAEFFPGPTQSIKTFWKQKFCSKNCADKGGLRHRGEANILYRPEARRRNRGGPHRKWVNAVLTRDGSACRHCGAKDIELHAHHVKSFRDHPELRFDVDNGLTLCHRCHWDVHTAQNENAVNSVEPRTGNAEGNTEPSERGNLLEGVTTRGRAFRRWIGKCEWCKIDISKAVSDTKGKKALFCSGSCRSKWIRKKVGPIKKPKAVISSTSAAPEREDIV